MPKQEQEQKEEQKQEAEKIHVHVCASKKCDWFVMDQLIMQTLPGPVVASSQINSLVTIRSCGDDRKQFGLGTFALQDIPAGTILDTANNMCHMNDLAMDVDLLKHDPIACLNNYMKPACLDRVNVITGICQDTMERYMVTRCLISKGEELSRWYGPYYWVTHPAFEVPPSFLHLGINADTYNQRVLKSLGKFVKHRLAGKTSSLKDPAVEPNLEQRPRFQWVDQNLHHSHLWVAFTHCPLPTL